MEKQKQEAKLVFYGVRGSYPVPRQDVCKYGGNTASILFERDDNIVILDAGTGIINIGAYLKKSKPHVKKVDIFISHLHSDHIQGIPFFEPVFDPQFEINIYCDDLENQKINFRDTVYSLFVQPLSPISIEGIKAKLNFISLDTGNAKPIVIDEGFTVEYLKEHEHPLAGVILYRVTVDGARVVYATDVETPGGFEGEYLAFIRDVDIMIHDSQYFDHEYYSTETPRKGFGHSTVSMAARNAGKAGVKKLYLFHYSPEYSDKDVENLLAEARKIFKASYLSEEGKKISL